jgi:hypothetical protein
VRSRSLMLAALLAVVATAMFTSASPAQAACTSSTPTSQSFADSLGDATDPTNPVSSNLAPDVTLTTLQVDGGCVMTSFSSYSNRSAGLLLDDAVLTYLDTDGNPATGDPVIGGADRVVGVLGDGSLPMLGTYNPASDSYEFIGGPFLAAAGTGGFAATLDQLGIGPSTNVGFAVATLWDAYFDMVPDAVFNTGLLRMGVSYSTAPPPPPPAPAQPTPPQTLAKNANSCTIPSTKKMKLSTALKALRDAGCSIGLTRQSHSRTVKRGRVVKSSPPAGLATNRSVVLYVSSGARRSRRAHRSSLSVAMRLDALSADLVARR